MKSFTLLFFIALNIILVGCKKDIEPRTKYPFLILNTPQIIENGVHLSGKIISTNGFNFEECGFVMSKSSKPVLTDYKRISELSLDDHNFDVLVNSGLEKGVTYYVRAYLKAGGYLVYSSEESFKSEGSLPPVISSFSPQKGVAGTSVAIKSANIENLADVVVKFGDVAAKIDSVSNNILYVKSPSIYQSGDVKITITAAGMSCVSQDSYRVIYYWTRKKDYTGNGIHSAVYLSLKGKGYMIGGIEYNSDLYTGGPESQKVMVYDPIADSWTQKRNTPFIPFPRDGGFVINDVIYVNCSDDNTIYKYNEESDTWSVETKIAYSGTVHTNFVIDGSVYLGIGNRYGFFQEFYRYNTITKEWSQISDFPGGERSQCVSFSVNGNGYVGFGYNLYEVISDLWEYSPVTNSWTKKNNFPGASRSMAISFILNSKVYIGLGSAPQNYSGFSDIWEYQLDSDSWIKIEDYIGYAKWLNIVFVLNNKAYIGMGAKSYGGGSSWDIFRSYKDLWEFDPNKNK